MNRVVWVALLGAIAMAWGTAPARAAEPPKMYALIVGAGDFSDPAIKTRPTAVSDAIALYETLTNPDYRGIPKENVTLLLSSKQEQYGAKPATKDNILAALKALSKVAQKDDLVFISLFGQGASIGQRTCYFCQDSTVKDRGNNALVGGAVENECKNLASQHLFVTLDIHFKGFDPGKENIGEPRLLDLTRAFLGIVDEEATIPTGKTVVLASRSPVSLVAPNKGGIFGIALIEALQGKADVEGDGADGLVTVEEAATYLEKRVPELAREFGTSREEKEQEPIALRGTSRFELTHNPAEWPRTKERLEKFAKLAGQLSDAEKLEGEKLLGRMPKLKALKELRQEYQKLADGVIALGAFQDARKRIEESRVLEPEIAKKYADRVMAGIDLVADEYIKILNRGEMTADAINGLYKRADETVPPELAKKLDSAKEMDRLELKDLLAEARLSLGKREDLDGTKDADMSLQMTLVKLDPYTIYIDAEEIKRTESQLTGRFTGIGVQIRRDLSRDGLLVITPIKGSPAYKAGLQAGDLITSIIREVDNNGDPLDKPEVVSTKGMRVDEAVKKILGQEGTEVKLTVEREGEAAPLTITLTRARIDVESVLGVIRKPDDSWEYYIDKAQKIAYIRLTQFTEKSGRELSRVVRQLEREGAKGLILDVRGNPGGYLTSAVEICDLFIDDGVIVRIRPRKGRQVEYTGRMDGSVLDLPMVCLINGESASASEILSACLQDHGRAIIMGSRSYGKGSVQNIQSFSPTQAKIKLTTATFWRPSDKNLNKPSTKGKEEEDWGVRPDKKYELILPPEEGALLDKELQEREIIPAKNKKAAPKTEKPFQDRQLDMAIEYLRGQVKLSSK
ncbi:S41 family peptidase [Tuwongella immobilis]|uniref:PDZ domain-containing protein n=1 Tax=Tuwongella immobilis TaxID=692036 RepID=A0A6C2YSI3_9BACT|nr:S41 family peptidase [Tuwongella immobilis]VIP03925.1 peptidase s41 : Protease OS=uncultured planctomycete GN=HGMM_F13D05C06 PE=3 SV=1: Peptidase_C14: PDZ_2: Peptidase_S41 [Tuwongella immobilis]VTS05217.1 peptidase s41 : Protease OS=uncultured planctomycete GN=HGMM_F13D05C06 PE=3 SV=1: Peptidase_C14: PDZ_2: Peptidase_S41 [Tuwongella immobilis]